MVLKGDFKSHDSLVVSPARVCIANLRFFSAGKGTRGRSSRTLTGFDTSCRKVPLVEFGDGTRSEPAIAARMGSLPSLLDLWSPSLSSGAPIRLGATTRLRGRDSLLVEGNDLFVDIYLKVKIGALSGGDAATTVATAVLRSKGLMCYKEMGCNENDTFIIFSSIHLRSEKRSGKAKTFSFGK